MKEGRTDVRDFEPASFKALNALLLIFFMMIRTLIIGKIGRIYTQLKNGFLFDTPSILASCGSHRRGKHGNLLTFAFFSLTYTSF
jgi:hypothetical protein